MVRSGGSGEFETTAVCDERGVGEEDLLHHWRAAEPKAHIQVKLGALEGNPEHLLAR